MTSSLSAPESGQFSSLELLATLDKLFEQTGQWEMGGGRVRRKEKTVTGNTATLCAGLQHHTSFFSVLKEVVGAHFKPLELSL